MRGLILALGMFAGTAGSAIGGTATFDFSTDPTFDPSIFIASNNDVPWQPSGGQPGGFLALTYPIDSQTTTVLFNDIDDGIPVKAFRFEADLRIGNSEGERAADGFSISFARSNDPIFSNPRNNALFAGGFPEAGTTTGISVSFDTWQGNALPDGPDVEGIIVRVNNVTVHREPLTTRHGACGDVNSLQTGPRDTAFWSPQNPNRDVRSAEAWDTLCWQPVVIELDENGRLTVSWKGRVVLPGFQTSFVPGAGRLVLASRTGAENEHTHIDNIRITTVQSQQPLVGEPAGSSCGFTIPILDAGTNTVQISTVRVRFNDVTLPASTRREGTSTIISVDTPSILTAGSTNSVEVSFTSSTGTPVSVTREFIAPASVTFPISAQAISFDPASSGFTVRPHRLTTPRGPGMGNTIEATETQLAGRFTDALNVPNPNIANLAGATGGVFLVPLINFEQFGDDIDFGNPTNSPDNFNSAAPTNAPRPNAVFPGITRSDANNFALEILTFLELPAGCHTLGVNSDDGFRVTLGHSQYGTVLGEFDADDGRAAADTTFRIVVTNAGVYPIRLAYSEGKDDASLEFFRVLPSGEKILINDRSNTNAIRSFSVGTTPGFLNDFGVTRASFGVNPGSRIIASFNDRDTALDDGSIRFTLDGALVSPSVTNAGPVTTVTYEPAGGFALGTAHTARLVYTIGAVTSTNTLRFRVRVGGLFVEAENFDFSDGETIAAVNTMPYTGGEYAGLGALHNLDYHRTDTSASGGANYRVGEVPEVPMYSRTNAGTLDLLRGDFLVATNFSVAGTSNAPAPGNWYDYTRTFTNGNYFVFAAQSFGEARDTNLPNRQRLRFVLVQTNGVERTIGSYSEPSTAGENILNQVMVGPVPAVITLGGQQTIRVYQEEGDFDWFVLVPTTNAVPEQQFIIEAEDFNYDGGLTLAAASIMPLTNAPYANLGAVSGIDFNVLGLALPTHGRLYRSNEVPNVPIEANDTRSRGDRGLYVRSPNYKIGPVDSGEWFNYTRTVPTNRYNVYAALSQGGLAITNRTAGSLQLVTTNATATNQVVTDLGTFEAEGPTGGWGANRLVPLAINGELATLALGGLQTLRYTAASGDIDYLVLVPTSAEVTTNRPRITGITRAASQIAITWTGGGTLESSPVVGPAAVWTPVAGAGAGTATVPMSAQNQFFRVRR